MTATTSSTGVDVRFEDGGDAVRCIVEVTSSGVIGKKAALRITRSVEVKDSRPVNARDNVFTTTIPSLQPHNAISIPRSALQLYTYRGEMIDIIVRTEIVVDGFIWDTTLRDDEEVGVWVKPAVSGDAKGIIDPKDAFDFIANFNAIPPKNKMVTAVLSFIGAIVVAINMLVGVHDQFAPTEAQTWFYDHSDSDGESESPLFKALAGSGVLGAILWTAIRHQLKQYMRFELGQVPARICAADEIPASTLVRGVSRVDLHNVRLRVVACNMEKGQYKRGSGTKERTVSFSTPVRAVILYDTIVQRIPAGAMVQDYFTGTVSFESMFRVLYPPQMLSTHGLSVHWEVQLIHEEFVDQELVGPIRCFPWEEFLDA